MRLIITPYHVNQSEGFMATKNHPVAIAFRMEHPDMEDVKVHHNRLTAIREGYPVRFLISQYTSRDHRLFLEGKIHAMTCSLKALPVPLTRITV